MLKSRNKLKLTTSIFALTLWCMGMGSVQAEPVDKTMKFASGRILVKSKPGLDEPKFLTILSKHGGKSDRKIGQTGVHIVKVPPGLEKKIVEELNAESSVEFAEVDGMVKPDMIPNDTYFANQWFHSKIGTPTAWDGASAAGITIAILDSGVEATHPDLQAVLVPGWNTVSQNTDTSAIHSHGTMVAGSAAGIFNNGIGVAGVAREAKIMPIRITNDSAGAVAYWSDVANGVTWAMDHGAKVVSNSYQSYQSSTVIAASDVLRTKGGLMTVSAGNQGTAYTNADSSMIVVGATDSLDNKASWSNTGPLVDVAAPGVGIYTTNVSGGYASVSGTSFSAPITAGLVALIMGVNPLLSPNDVENILESTTVDLGVAGRDDLYGNGRIDAAAAIAKAKTFVPTTADIILPVVSVSNPLAGSKVAGLVPVDILASDNVGVTRVDMMVNGAFYASDTTSPYNFVWDTTSLKNVPSMTLSAVAVDAAGNKATSTGVAVQVENIVDTMPPVVSITNPANNSKVSGTVSIKASITDDVGVSSSSLLIDGKVVSTGTGSISYTWNTRKAKAGTHTISVVGKDTSNNTTTSQITVTK